MYSVPSLPRYDFFTHNRSAGNEGLTDQNNQQFIATIDLILTQTLGAFHVSPDMVEPTEHNSAGPKLLWHLMFNFSLGKIYVISLLYTLNSINQYRRKRGAVSQEMYASDGRIGIGRVRFFLHDR